MRSYLDGGDRGFRVYKYTAIAKVPMRLNAIRVSAMRYGKRPNFARPPTVIGVVLVSIVMWIPGSTV